MFLTCSFLPEPFDAIVAWKEKYSALLGYIEKQEYPPGFNSNQKYVLRRASKSYQLIGDQLHYIDHNADGSTFQRLVL